jgi:hypothetical protein
MEPYDNPLFKFPDPIVENGMETIYVDNLGIKIGGSKNGRKINRCVLKGQSCLH